MIEPQAARRLPAESGAPDPARGPIARTSLHQVVLGRVRDMIVEGTLSPGTRIHEGELARELGVSHTPLREALKFLASEGLVELSPGRGAVVRAFSTKDVRDNLFLTARLEGFAGRLACDNASDAAIAEIRAMHDAMMERFHARDRLPYFKINQDIHSAIIRAAGNVALREVHTLLQARLKRIRYQGHEGANWPRAVADHEEIIAALEARDGSRLEAAMIRHLESAWDRVKDIL